MIECHIDNCFVIGPHFSERCLSLDALGGRQENTQDILPVHQAKHTPSHLPVGNLDASDL